MRRQPRLQTIQPTIGSGVPKVGLAAPVIISQVRRAPTRPRHAAGPITKPRLVRSPGLLLINTGDYRRRLRLRPGAVEPRRCTKVYPDTRHAVPPPRSPRTSPRSASTAYEKPRSCRDRGSLSAIEKTRLRWTQSRVSRRFIRTVAAMVRTHVLRIYGPHLQPPSNELSTDMAVPRQNPRKNQASPTRNALGLTGANPNLECWGQNAARM
jgi:hypothetical protein